MRVPPVTPFPLHPISASLLSTFGLRFHFSGGYTSKYMNRRHLFFLPEKLSPPKCLLRDSSVSSQYPPPFWYFVFSLRHNFFRFE